MPAVLQLMIVCVVCAEGIHLSKTMLLYNTGVLERFTSNNPPCKSRRKLAEYFGVFVHPRKISGFTLDIHTQMIPDNKLPRDILEFAEASFL